MKLLINKAETFAAKFENKAVKIVAFWTAITALIAFIPTFFGFLYGIFIFGQHLYNLDDYITNFKAAQEYDHFMIMQLTAMIEAESDLKESFGTEVRMTNPPKGVSQGDLWYFTYVKINDTWRPVIYGAFPYITKKKVGIWDMHNERGIAGEEPHPKHEELEILHNHNH